MAVAGSIGAGKTSLVSWMSERYGLRALVEPHDNNAFLEDFYRDMQRWAFHSQCAFLAEKIRLHDQIETTKGVHILDRTLYEDAEIFARSLYRSRTMSAREWRVYERLYESLRVRIEPPRLLVAVRCKLAATKRRIKQRGRAMELDVPEAYLRRLDRLYKRFFESWSLCPKIEIDTTDMDYVEDWLDLIELRRRLDEAMFDTCRVRPKTRETK